MRPGRDVSAEFPGLFVVHHNKPKSRVERHSHREHHLIIPLRGESWVRIEDTTFSFGPGKMLYIPSGLEHEFVSSNQKEGERLIALVGDALWKKVEGPRTRGALLLPTRILCKELLFQLVTDPNGRAVREMVLCFVSVLVQAINETETYGSSDSVEQALSKSEDPRVLKAVDFLRENFSTDLKISQLAKRAGLSERNLNRLFVQETGFSPKQALIRLRLERAQELLRSGKVSVTDACFDVGYSSLSRFIQGYRATFGKLPSEES